jgi:hypothetical protein
MTLVNVTSEELAANNGRVACDHCHTHFTVTKTEDITAHADDAVATPVIAADARRDLLQASLQSPSTRRKGGWLWGIVSLLLALLLAGQFAYFKRDELAEDARLRPWLVTFCAYARCELKPIRAPERIRILSREVRSHPTIKNTLLIELVLANEAPFRQPWPTLQLTFSDINGQTVARRSFKPGEYLQTDYNLADGMPSRTPVSIELVLVDPGKKAVNFVFAFH